MTQLGDKTRRQIRNTIEKEEKKRLSSLIHQSVIIEDNKKKKCAQINIKLFTWYSI